MVMENEKAKIMWDVEFHLETAPLNGANKIDMAVLDKEEKVWNLIEGTVCTVGLIKEKTELKFNKYRELRTGIKRMYPEHCVRQLTIVFDYLGGYHSELDTGMKDVLSISKERERQWLITNCQKWVISQNCEIVKTFYAFME